MEDITSENISKQLLAFIDEGGECKDVEAAVFCYLRSIRRLLFLCQEKQYDLILQGIISAHDKVTKEEKSNISNHSKPELQRFQKKTILETCI